MGSVFELQVGGGGGEVSHRPAHSIAPMVAWCGGSPLLGQIGS